MEKTNETLESIKIEEKEEKVSYERLEEEIKIEEESRKLDNIENFKKSQKPKKKLKNKILAWVLGSAIFAGAAAGGGYLIYDNVAGDKAYNEAIQTRYEQVDEKLTFALASNTAYSMLNDRKITNIRFLEPGEEDAYLEVYYKGISRTSDLKKQCCAIFKVFIDYYNALVEGEENNDPIEYLDALYNVFENMELVSEKYINNISCELKENTKKNKVKFNELFNVDDVDNEDIVKQIGFLPYYVQVVSYNVDPDTALHTYTYKISGISYCETKSESNDKIYSDEDLIINDIYNNNHVKAFNREILFTVSDTVYGEIDLNVALGYDIKNILNGANLEHSMETLSFNEINLFELYNKIKNDDFKYKKPKDFNVKDYMESITEEKPNTEDYEIL